MIKACCEFLDMSQFFLCFDIKSYFHKYSADFQVQFVYFGYFVRNMNKEMISC